MADRDRNCCRGCRNPSSPGFLRGDHWPRQAYAGTGPRQLDRRLLGAERRPDGADHLGESDPGSCAERSAWPDAELRPGRARRASEPQHRHAWPELPGWLQSRQPTTTVGKASSSQLGGGTTRPNRVFPRGPASGGPDLSVSIRVLRPSIWAAGRRAGLSALTSPARPGGRGGW